uniref:Annexin n=1 Tax=Acrobeloides nanus TaxID=290746 RepID=A0A914CX85_9BILA
MKGFGSNKSKIILILCGRSSMQRQEIAKQYKVQFGEDLNKRLKSELSGDFEEFILGLMEPPAQYDAHQLHKAMSGLGTKEHVLIEILTSRTNAQIIELKQVYKQLYRKELEDDIKGDTSGHLERLLVSLSQGARDVTWNTDPLKANQDARELYREGEKKLGTDESLFNRILATQNFLQLRLVFDEYEKVSKHPIEKAIESEFSGDIKNGLLSIVKVVRNRIAYFAEQLYNSMKGPGTRDSDLIRLIVSRSEIDLVDIRQEYEKLYKTSLEKAIESDTSGAYKEGLIAIVRGNH